MTDINKQFGQTIKVLRESKGYSQEKLAELCEFHRTYIGMIERAERNITLKNIEKIALGLDTSILELFKIMQENTLKEY